MIIFKFEFMCDISVSSMDTIPIELLQDILSYNHLNMSNGLLVCKKWYRMITSASYYREQLEWINLYATKCIFPKKIQYCIQRKQESIICNVVKKYVGDSYVHIYIAKSIINIDWPNIYIHNKHEMSWSLDYDKLLNKSNYAYKCPYEHRELIDMAILVVNELINIGMC